MPKRKPSPPHHDFTGQIGSGYACSVCHQWLTPNNQGQVCPGDISARKAGALSERPANYVQNTDPVGTRLWGMRV